MNLLNNANNKNAPDVALQESKNLESKNVDSKTIGFIVPCFNEEKNLDLFFSHIQKIMQECNWQKYEILFINDGSMDNTLLKIKDLASQNCNIKYISFSRNFGKESAMIAGFRFLECDCAILLDADLQHPVELIPQMIEKWLEGYKMILGLRKNRHGESAMRAKLSEMFYKTNNIISKIKLQKGLQDFGLFDKSVYKELALMDEYHRFTKGMINWVGFKRYYLYHDHIQRNEGVSSFNFFRLFKYAIDGIISFSTAPLRLAFIIGFIISAMSVVYGFYMIFDKICFGNPIQGYTSIIVMICFLCGLQFIIMGILGEYIARIYEQSKNRPHFIIEESNINA